MLYRTDDFARWGAGKGTNLEPVEIDGNFWELAERLVAVEAAAGEAANGIANIGVVGSQMTVYLEDGTALGPYTLPTAMIRYRGDWAAAAAYSELDLVTVPDVGVYLVLVDHTSDATAFDALGQDAEGNPLYRFLFPMGTGGEVGASSVAQLTDVDLVSEPPVDGQTLVYFGGTWYPGVPQMVLGDLQGVFITEPPFSGGLEDGHVLTWVAADSAWRNRPPAAGGGGASALDDLSDVVITSPAAAQFLRYDGTAFVNAVVSWGDIDSKPATFAPSAHTHPWGEITGRPATVDALPATVGTNGQVMKALDGAIVWGTDDTGGGAGSGAAVSDEGTQILSAPTDLNFVGDGVTVTDDGDGTVTITIPGGAAFGGALNDLSDVTITGPTAGQFLRYDGAVFVNAVVDWSDLANKPATFAPSAHTHPWGDLTGVPATFPPDAHTHPAADIAGAVIETITGTAYTQVAADARKWKRTTSADPVTITIDANVNAAADEITFQQGAAGQITFAAGTGLTLTTSGSLTSAGQNAVIGLKFLSATEAMLFGQTTETGGGGSGDMTKAVYDPQAIAADAFARANHTGEQAIGTITGLQTALDAKAAAAHTHAIADTTGLQAELDGKAPVAHTHDDRYYTEAEADALLAGKAASAHTHAITDTTGLQAELDAKAAAAHGHAIADTTGLQAELDAKAAATHGHAIADVTGLQAELDGKAATAHTHDDRYYTEAEADALLAGKAAASHTHPVADLQTTGTPDGTKFLRDDGAWAAAGAGSEFGGSWQNFTGSRSASTVYQNTTGKPIGVHFHAAASTGREFQTSPDNATWGRAGFVQNGSPTIPQTTFVPADHYYRIDGSVTSISAWWELR